jgi:hypothetical protein
MRKLVKVKFLKVKGHSRETGNDSADRLAVMGATKYWKINNLCFYIWKVKFNKKCFFRMTGAKRDREEGLTNIDAKKAKHDSVTIKNALEKKEQV